MRFALRLGLALSVMGSCLAAYAGTTAGADIKLLSVSGGNFNYDITLFNTGTTSIGTFWFSWIPGEDFMPDMPTNVVAPTGWTVNKITHGGSTDGYAIRWESTTGLAAGQDLDGFTFSSVDSPSTLAMDSPFYPGTPTLTAFVYQGGPFVGGSDQILVKQAPAPPALFSGVLGLALPFLRRKKRA